MELSELSAKIDQYIATRDERRQLQKQTDNLASVESALKNEIIGELRSSNAKSAGGSVYTLTIERVDKPVAGDWSKVYEWIQRNDSFDLLQKRLNESAVEARWEEGIEIPGISRFPVDKLSVTKR